MKEKCGSIVLLKAGVLVGLGLLVLGVIASRIGDSLATVNASDQLQEHPLMLLGFILIILCPLTIVSTALCLLFKFLLKRKKSSS